MPTNIETSEIPEGNLTVEAGEIRDITERLFHTASGISLAEWSPMANNLLGAASRLEQHAALLSSLRKLVGEWKHKSSDFVDRWEGYSDDGDLRSARSIQDCATELEKLLAAHPEFK